MRPTVGADFHSHRDVIVHEATHAIQDRNRWRYSPLDAEVDALDRRYRAMAAMRD